MFLSVEELKGLVVDYNVELDKPLKGVPPEYLCEDDDKGLAGKEKKSENATIA